MTHQELTCLHGSWQDGYHYEYTPCGWVLRRNPPQEPQPAPRPEQDCQS